MPNVAAIPQDELDLYEAAARLLKAHGVPQDNWLKVQFYIRLSAAEVSFSGLSVTVGWPVPRDSSTGVLPEAEPTG